MIVAAPAAVVSGLIGRLVALPVLKTVKVAAPGKESVPDVILSSTPAVPHLNGAWPDGATVGPQP